MTPIPENPILKNIVALVNQASMAALNQNYPQAMEAYTSAVKQAFKLGRPQLVTVLLNQIGDTFQAQGEIQEAVFAYEAALQTLESGEDVKADAVIQRIIQTAKGFYSNPETIPDLYSAEVQKNLETAESEPSLAIWLWLNVGNAYLRQPQLSSALNAYQQARYRAETKANPLLTAYAIANIGEIHRRQRQLDLAEAELEQALQLFESIGQPLEKRRALAFMAALKRNQQQPQAAEALFKQALTLYDQAQDQLGKGKAVAGLARLYLEQNRFSEAREGYQQAQQIAQSQNDQEVLGYCYWGLGCCHQAAGELALAIDCFQACFRFIERRQKDLLTDEGKISFLDSIKDVFDRLLTAHLDLVTQTGGDFQAALEVAESGRGRVLQDLMRGQQRRRPQLQTELPANTPDLSATIGLDHSDTIGPDQPLAIPRLVFHVLQDRTAIFAVTAAGQVSGFVSPLGRAQLEQTVAQLRRALHVDEAARGVERKLVAVTVPPAHDPAIALADLLQSLYADLIAPVADALPVAGTPLLLEPHGVLWLLPFAALQRPDLTWFGDHWPLLYAPSQQAFDEIRQEPNYASLAASKVLVVGNPIMPKVATQDGVELILGPLSGAESEAKEIVNALGNRPYTLLLREDATESAVKELAQTHNILHLATHGIAYTDDPLNSFIAFSPTATENGLLTAREVASRRNLPADLVVLSACQTGLGRISGDGMLGLSRAYLIAGARTVVVSQWSVSDPATALLMQGFYQNYLNSGDKALALQQAMQQVRSIAEYQHPRFWAAFMAIGDFR
jgi:tetratricopeptide (TPR) repeat protein